MDLFLNRRRLELSLLVGLLAALCWGMWAQQGQQALADRVVRMHILANSDSEADQALKLQVRDAVLAETEAVLRTADSRQEAETRLRELLPQLEQTAERVTAEAGTPYPVAAEVRRSRFPTRTYDGFALPAGEYLALRLTIGAGEGRNWWCVVFPPLCAQTTTDTTTAAMAAGLGEEELCLMTGQDGYVLKFKSIELWDAVRSRVFGGN